MNGPKHTPGPWASRPWNGRMGSHPAVAAEGDGYGYYVAHCNDYHASDEENEANAILIAAAPDLLEATLVGELFARRLSRGEMLTEEEINEWVATAQSALAKAMGGDR